MNLSACTVAGGGAIPTAHGAWIRHQAYPRRGPQQREPHRPHRGLVINSDGPDTPFARAAALVTLLCPTLSPGGRPVGLLKEEMPRYTTCPVGTKWGAWHAVAVFQLARPFPADDARHRVARHSAGADIYLYDFWSGTGSFEKSGAIDMGEMEPPCMQAVCITENFRAAAPRRKLAAHHPGVRCGSRPSGRGGPRGRDRPGGPRAHGGG